eukprot:5207849-Pyramimonas_sp.AAC.1
MNLHAKHWHKSTKSSIQKGGDVKLVSYQEEGAGTRLRLKPVLFRRRTLRVRKKLSWPWPAHRPQHELQPSVLKRVPSIRCLSSYTRSFTRMCCVYCVQCECAV